MVRGTRHPCRWLSIACAQYLSSHQLNRCPCVSVLIDMDKREKGIRQ